jgi:Mrp family chromosome partitioning ATPase
LNSSLRKGIAMRRMLNALKQVDAVRGETQPTEEPAAAKASSQDQFESAKQQKAEAKETEQVRVAGDVFDTPETSVTSRIDALSSILDEEADNSESGLLEAVQNTPATLESAPEPFESKATEAQVEELVEPKDAAQATVSFGAGQLEEHQPAPPSESDEDSTGDDGIQDVGNQDNRDQTHEDPEAPYNPFRPKVADIGSTLQSVPGEIPPPEEFDSTETPETEADPAEPQPFSNPFATFEPPTNQPTSPTDTENSWLSDLSDDLESKQEEDEIVLGAASFLRSSGNGDESVVADRSPSEDSSKNSSEESSDQSESATPQEGQEEALVEEDEFVSLRRPFDPAANTSYKPRPFEAEIVACLAGPESARQYKQVANSLEKDLLREVDRTIAVIGLGDSKTNAEVAVSLTYTLAGNSPDNSLLMIDGNLSEKIMSKGFGLDSGLGITEFLNRSEEELQQKHRTIVPSVTFMPAGKAIYAEVSGAADRAATWLAECKQQHKFVIVDAGAASAPPAALWGRVCDAVYLSLDLAEVSPILAEETVELLRRSGTRVLGVIVVQGTPRN